MRVSTAIASALLAAIAVLGIAAPASAHDQLLSTDPENGSTVATLPDKVTLTFNDVVQDAGAEANQVKVMDASCTVIDDGAVEIADNVVTQKISGTATGPITVLWRVVSRDGHPVSGEFSFTVGDAAATASPSPCATGDITSSTSATAQSSPVPWIIGGIVLVVIVAGVILLLVTRSRRPDDQ
ncbi:copper resistance protein CopC [Microbacterium horticulturae]|uniref:Copper resistance protein CopC n=1 Tax=Microbacterium horticulturae TaxID=3028316 RepID=A0ABY8C112_9MICO|nr:copper resistance CopC family protein [Microbacterium sp. KACC 23027]WEG10136.1 copper resistance protein CopC [Microbacterium sp. KACC 23027]